MAACLKPLVLALLCAAHSAAPAASQAPAGARAPGLSVADRLSALLVGSSGGASIGAGAKPVPAPQVDTLTVGVASTEDSDEGAPTEAGSRSSSSSGLADASGYRAAASPTEARSRSSGSSTTAASSAGTAAASKPKPQAAPRQPPAPPKHARSEQQSKQPEPVASGVASRRLSATDQWLPTRMIYLRGPRDWQHRLFVGFQSGGVASVNSDTGELNWAHGPAAARGAVQGLLQKRGTLVSAAAGGVVQGWDINDGSLKWEHECPGGVWQKMLDVGGKSDAFAFACASAVEYRTIEGERVWRTAPPSGGDVKVAAAGLGGAWVCALATGTTGSAGASALRLDADSGQVLESVAVPEEVSAALGASNFIATGEYIVFFRSGTLYAYSVCGTEKLASLPLPGDLSVAPTLENCQDTPGVFMVSNSKASSSYRILPDQLGIGLVAAEDAAAEATGPVYGAVYGETGNSVAVAVPRQATLSQAGGVEVSIRHAKFGDVQATAAAAGAFKAADHGTVHRIVVQQLGSGAFRALLATSRQSLLAVEGSRILWARKEFSAQKAEL